MKYLIMIYANAETRKVWESLSHEQRYEGTRGYAELNDELGATGESIAHEALTDPDQGKRVTVREGKVLTTDGPFAEAKEFLAGFYLIDCEGIDRAVSYAARVPEAEMGMVEVRPILDLSDLGI